MLYTLKTCKHFKRHLVLMLCNKLEVIFRDWLQILLEVNQHVPGNENYLRLPLPQRWLPRANVSLYSNCIFYCSWLKLRLWLLFLICRCPETENELLKEAAWTRENLEVAIKSIREDGRSVHRVAKQSGTLYSTLKKNWSKARYHS